MTKKKIFKTFINLVNLILVVSIIVSCETSTNPVSNQIVYSLGNGVNPDEPYSVIDALTYYDTTHIIAKINIIDEFRTRFDNNYNFINEEEYIADAQLWEIDSLLTFAGININDYSMSSLSTNFPLSCILYGKGNPLTQEGMMLNFGFNSNNIFIHGNNIIPELDTNLTFLSPLLLSNLNNGDTLFATQSFSLYWSGATSGFIGISLQEIHNSDTSFVPHSANVITKNDGQFTLTQNDINNAPEDWYYLSLLRYEPYFLELSNGKKIAVIVQSHIQRLIYIKH